MYYEALTAVLCITFAWVYFELTYIDKVVDYNEEVIWHDMLETDPPEGVTLVTKIGRKRKAVRFFSTDSGARYCLFLDSGKVFNKEPLSIERSEWLEYGITKWAYKSAHDRDLFEDRESL